MRSRYQSVHTDLLIKAVLALKNLHEVIRELTATGWGEGGACNFPPQEAVCTDTSDTSRCRAVKLLSLVITVPF